MHSLNLVFFLLAAYIMGVFSMNSFSSIEFILVDA